MTFEPLPSQGFISNEQQIIVSILKDVVIHRNLIESMLGFYIPFMFVFLKFIRFFFLPVYAGWLSFVGCLVMLL